MVSDTFFSIGTMTCVSNTFSVKKVSATFSVIRHLFSQEAAINLAAVLFLAFLVKVATIHVVDDNAGEIFNFDPADGFRS